MSKIIKSNNHETKNKKKNLDSSMLFILSKLPSEIISDYPHKSLYRCFSTYLRKNPSIILKVHESKSIYNEWRMKEAQRRKKLRNQKRIFSLNKCEKKYIYTNLSEGLDYCYENEQLLNLDQTIDEDFFKKKIREQIEEIDNDMLYNQDNEILYNLDNDYEVHNFIHHYFPL